MKVVRGGNGVTHMWNGPTSKSESIWMPVYVPIACSMKELLFVAYSVLVHKLEWNGTLNQNRLELCLPLPFVRIFCDTHSHIFNFWKTKPNHTLVLCQLRFLFYYYCTCQQLQQLRYWKVQYQSYEYLFICGGMGGMGGKERNGTDDGDWIIMITQRLCNRFVVVGRCTNTKKWKGNNEIQCERIRDQFSKWARQQSHSHTICDMI